MSLFILVDVTPVNETPVQDYDVIKEDLLNRRKLRRDVRRDAAWVDPVFPPDLSSLTYVYSGDDKYERMKFRRVTVCPSILSHIKICLKFQQFARMLVPVQTYLCDIMFGNDMFGTGVWN